MKTASASRNRLSHTVPDDVVVEKIRWSLRQRLRKQLHKLNTEFFDEVDDFFFSSSKQAQSDEANSYLMAMRELRCKQSLVEESFLADVLQQLKQAESRVKNTGLQNGSVAGFERVEIDLAFRAMQRKADRAYSEQLKKIESLNEELTTVSNTEVVSGLTLIEAVLLSFMHSQECLNLPLDIRLVFIKLFEQHFLLRMEKLLLDISSILRNAGNPEFVEKLYSSSSAFGNQVKTSQFDKTLSSHPDNKSDFNTAIKPEDVETEVSELVAQLCDSHRMPIFIERMLRTQWRSVMYVLGLNVGCFSAEWNEAKYCALLLAAAASEGSVIGGHEKSLVLDQLAQGFDLVRIEQAVQDSFFEQLNKLFGTAAGAFGGTSVNIAAIHGQVVPAGGQSNSEISISPSGKRVLSQEDLSELTKLMGGGEEKPLEPSNDNDLDAYFRQVDKIPSKQEAEFKSGQKHRPCRVYILQSGGFEIRFNDGGSSVKLSRLSLAMSLKFGDLLLEDNDSAYSFSEISVTVDKRQLH
ncbi:MAG: DUF1631 family protein [Pseudohongiellaceae bacterium]